MNFDSLPGNGWLTFEEATLLWDSVNLTTGAILEVGCYYGRSTCLLAQTGRMIYSVDPFDHFDSDDPSGDFVYSKFLANLLERKIVNVSLYRQKIEDWVIHDVGFAYLDGDHTYEGTVRQLEIAYKAGAKLICVHDYINTGEGREIIRAVEESKWRMVEHVGRMAKCELAL